MDSIAPQRFELEPIEVAPVEVLRELQLHRLKWSLRHAYENVPHYRQAFDARGVKPEDLRSLSDLAKFPFTSKQDLRANYPYGMFAVPQSRIARIHASSGTTGKPTVVGYTKRDLETWAQCVGRCIRASGGRPGMKLHNAYGYGLFTGGLGYHDGAEYHGLTVIPVSGGMTERQVQLIREFEPDIITVTPSYMLAILDEFRRQGHDPRKTSLKVGIFGAEPWTDAMRAEIEAAFDIHAVDTYGLSEVIGPGVANECIETKDGPHIWEDHFYPEVIDPATGEVLPDGQPGELVFTSLTKEALPIIRYRTRDLTRLMPGTARTMRRMARVTGRSDDMMIVRGVNVFPTQIEEQILKVTGLAPHYVIVLTREGRMDEMEVVVEKSGALVGAPSVAHTQPARLLDGASGADTAPALSAGASGADTAPALSAGASGADTAPALSAGASGADTAPALSAGASGADTAPAPVLAHLIKSLCGVTAKVTIAEPGGVERSQGKARRVIDKRPKE